MDLQLSGKRALVTGSTGGIGEGIAKVLAHEGANVIVHGRNEKQADRVAHEINNSSCTGKAYIVIGDLSKDEDANKVFRQCCI